MSEQDLISERRFEATREGVTAASTPDTAPPGGYGARLAWERQRAGLGVTDVAARLRLHANQVRAIEQEDLSRLPELAYVRGFIRGYARVLNIDPAPLLCDLNTKLAPTQASVVDGMAGTSDYSPVRAAARERMSRQWVIGIAVVGLIALGVVGWLTTRQDMQTRTPTAALAPARPAPVAAPADTAPPAAGEATTTSAADAQPASTEAKPESVSGANPSEAVPTLMLRFSGQSWVEVTDANGRILLSQLSSAGAEHALDGEVPLTVVIGDAGKTSVEVRGEAFNLQPFTRNNVARITIN